MPNPLSPHITALRALLDAAEKAREAIDRRAVHLKQGSSDPPSREDLDALRAFTLLASPDLVAQATQIALDGFAVFDSAPEKPDIDTAVRRLVDAVHGAIKLEPSAGVDEISRAMWAYQRAINPHLVAALLRIAIAKRDDPSLDGTDAAHPAWWRGHDNGAKGMEAQVSRLREERDHYRRIALSHQTGEVKDASDGEA